MGYVYWRWLLATSTALDEQRNAGTLSRLHRVHPTYPDRITWCGCLVTVGPKYGIAQAYHTDKPQKGAEMCQECARMRAPMQVFDWLLPHEQIALLDARERKRLEEKRIREEKEAEAQRMEAEIIRHREIIQGFKHRMATERTEEREACAMAYRLEHLLHGVEWDRIILGLCAMCGNEMDQPLTDMTQTPVYCGWQCRNKAIGRMVKARRAKEKAEKQQAVSMIEDQGDPGDENDAG